MAATKYTYSIQNDFPNHKVDSSRLTNEIRASAIVTALDYINTSGDDCDIWFKDALSGGDQTVLAGLVAAHSGEPLPETPLPVTLPDINKTVDNRLAVRTSSTNRMNNFKLRAVTFYTSELVEGLHNVNPVTGLSYGDVTMQLFKANGDEILTEQDEIYAVKTVLNFDPTYDYEIIGGYMDTPTSIKDGATDQWYVSAIGVPDYPPEYYGSIDFISEVNLEAITVQRVVSDGRAISYMPYNYGGNPYTNRLRLIIKHPVGERKRFQFFIEHFTP